MVTVKNSAGPHHTKLMHNVRHRNTCWWNLESTGGRASYNVGLATVRRCAEAGGYEVSLEVGQDEVVFRLQGAPILETSPKIARNDVVWALDDSTRSWCTLRDSRNVDDRSFDVLGLDHGGLDVCVDRLLAASPPVDVLLVNDHLEMPTSFGGTAAHIYPDVGADLLLRGFQGRVIMCPAGLTNDQRGDVLVRMCVTSASLSGTTESMLSSVLNTSQGLSSLPPNESQCMRIVYISRIVGDPLEPSMIATFEKHNRSVGITGTLVMIESLGTYIHTLEGPLHAVHTLWGAIMRDARHHTVRVVYTTQFTSTEHSPQASLQYKRLTIFDEQKQKSFTADVNSVIKAGQNIRVIIHAIDDMALVRRLMVRLLSSIPGNVEYHVKGATDKEIGQFIDNVMTARPPVDIVIMDNVLTSPTHSAPTVYGLDMAADLVLRGYAGEIIISSANELEHDYINMAKGTTVAVKKKLLQRVLKNVREKRTSATKEKLVAV